MRSKIFLFLITSFLFLDTLSSQVNSVVIQPNATAGKDALVIDVNPSSNYETLSFFRITKTSSYIDRTFIEMDVSSIPTNAIIVDARLRLYRFSGYSSTHNIEVNKVINSWDESTITWSNAPNVTSVDMIIQSMGFTNNTFHDIDVTSHVQDFVNYPNTNLGWRLKCQNESSANGGAYRSSDYGTFTQRPRLEVDYVLPIEIELQSITHASSSTVSDGSITVDVSEGDGSYTYEWIDGSTGNVMTGQTTSTINGLSHGWYGVHITDGEGVEAYKAFLVGASCETVTIDFDPGPNFIEDAMIYNLVRLGIDYGATYNGGASTVVPRADNWTYGSWYDAKSLTKFNIDIAQDLEIETSDLYIYGTGNHWNHTGTNESEINRVTTDWEEFLVTYDMAPSTTTLNQILLAQTTTSSQNEVVDLLNFFEHWQQNPTSNYGFMFELQNPTPNSYRRRHYWSSDGSGTKPKVEFEVSIKCVMKKNYIELQRSLDGGHYDAVNDTLSVIHREEYVDTDGLLEFRILDYQGNEVLTSSNQSVAIKPGYNEVEIDVSSLTTGFYTLEVTNQKEETLKLRFKI